MKIVGKTWLEREGRNVKRFWKHACERIKWFEEHLDTYLNNK